MSKNGFNKIKNIFLNQQFILFVFCGGIGTLTNFISSLIFSLWINPTIAYVFGYVLSLAITYLLNAKLIFKKSLQLGDYFKFVLSYIPNFIILVSFVFIFLNLFGWHKILVYALVSLLGLPITFVLVKIFAFKNKI